MTQLLTLPRPDDFHVHLRDGEVLRAVLPFTAAAFGRAIVMPNLRPPVTTTARALTYRDEIRAALPKDADFSPLMTLYLTDKTDPDDLEKGFRENILTAAKLYPASATTNAEAGISDIKHIYPALTRMQRLKMPLLIHGEVTDPGVDIFDREAVFIERVLIPLRHAFPELKIVLEHITTAEASAYVAEEGKKGLLAATITAHHLHINRNALFAGGLRPHNYCLPVAKREKHRRALVAAATSGQRMFFLGTDSAPHVNAAKECACGCAGIFTAPTAMPLYAQIFDDAGKLENLEAFACRNGAAFYALPVNKGQITLIKEPRPLPFMEKAGTEEALQEKPLPNKDSGESALIKPILTETGQKITAFAPPSPLLWRYA